jgi:hypothetical protein
MNVKTMGKKIISCLNLVMTQGEWLREAVDEKTVNESLRELSRPFLLYVL